MVPSRCPVSHSEGESVDAQSFVARGGGCGGGCGGGDDDDGGGGDAKSRCI